jgi:hypothetical protein
MADPFGIIGVIGVVAQLIQTTVQFGLDWKDAYPRLEALLTNSKRSKQYYLKRTRISLLTRTLSVYFAVVIPQCCRNLGQRRKA